MLIRACVPAAFPAPCSGIADGSIAAAPKKKRGTKVAKQTNQQTNQQSKSSQAAAAKPAKAATAATAADGEVAQQLDEEGALADGEVDRKKRKRKRKVKGTAEGGVDAEAGGGGGGGHVDNGSAAPSQPERHAGGEMVKGKEGDAMARQRALDTSSNDPNRLKSSKSKKAKKAATARRLAQMRGGR